jgi:DNA-binding response OmpR family regulator
MSIDATILIIEDDPAMIAGLKDNLELEGYRIATATTVRQGRLMALQEHPDLIVLDVMLPDGDGISLCRELRAQGVLQPIIMLTARSEEMDKVQGFDGGADDYIVKPFGLRELLARVHAQLRRHSGIGQVQGIVAVGMAKVDFRRHQLSRDGALQDVSAKELDLLRYLVQHRGTVVSRDTLLTEVWGHQREVATRTVDNFIVRLRKKIEIDPAAPQYLITVHGSGYKLVDQ